MVKRRVKAQTMKPVKAWACLNAWDRELKRFYPSGVPVILKTRKDAERERYNDSTIGAVVRVTIREAPPKRRRLK